MSGCYQHKNIQGAPFQYAGQLLPVGKVLCVGRNYLDHIQELGNESSELPLLFIKPATALVDINEPLLIPTAQGACHNELELAFLIGNKLTNADEQQCSSAIAGVGLALDLTLRDLQGQLKSRGHPWERAKAFDASCPISGFVPLNGYQHQRFTFSLHLNGALKQQGDSDLMLHKVVPLLAHISQTFTLMPGDILLTGTPKGVGPLQSGDTMQVALNDYFEINTHVAGEL
jgi:2-keto-4-pentenoate hydratase/2-oxohepta-3-ene-1,7-dioic acid hydratase in catechol pathway